ncbi:unnamed protein product, partial [Prorocentrum cordatum]
IVKRRQAVVEGAGGYRHLPIAEYEQEFKKFETNGMAAHGHKEWTYNGVPGYYVPNRTTTFKFVTIDESVVTTQAGSTEGCEITKAQLDRISSAFFTDLMSFVNGRGNSAEPAMLRVNLGSQGDVALPAPPASSDSALPAGASPAASPPPKGPPPAAEPEPGSGNKRGAPADAVDGAAEDLETKPKPARKSGGKAAAAGQASTSAGAKKKAGKPPKKWGPVIEAVRTSFANSSSNDPNFWGSEAKTQIKQMNAYSKDILSRCRKTTDAEEVTTLERLMKELVVMIAFVTVVKDHGVDSEQFKEVHDLQVEGLPMGQRDVNAIAAEVTSMGLAPVVTLTLPTHIKWARHKMDIRDTDDTGRWFSRISTRDLAQVGFGGSALQTEQDKLVSVRLAAALKLKSKKERLDALGDLFDMDRELDLVDNVKDFCEALTVLIAAPSFTDASVCVEALSGAFEAIGSPAISSLVSCGVLTGFPHGKEWMKEMKLYMAQVQNSKADVESMAALGEAIAATIRGAPSDGAEPAELSAIAAQVGSYISKRAAVVDRCPELFLAELPTTESMGAERLGCWTASQRTASVALTEASKVAFPGSTASPFVEAAKKCERIGTWLTSVNSFLSQEASSAQVSAVRDMQLGYNRDVAQPFPLEVQESDSFFSECLSSFVKSPLLRAGGAYNAKIMGVLTEAGNAKLAPILSAISHLLKCSTDSAHPVRSFDPACIVKEDFAAMKAAIPSPDTWAAATAWASGLGDQLLGNQLNVIRNIFAVTVSLVDVFAIAEEKSAPCKVHVDCVLHLRTVARGLATVSGCWSQPSPNDESPYHVNVLRGLIDYASFSSALAYQVKVVQLTISSTWTSMIKGDVDRIAAGCPVWRPFKAEMCSNAAVVKSLIDNK